MSKFMLAAVAAVLAVAGVTVGVSSAGNQQVADPLVPVTPITVVPGQPDVVQTVKLDNQYSATTSIGTEILSGTPGTVMSAPSGCARTHFNITYVYLGLITEWTESHAVQGCYSNYKINSVSENSVSEASSCCGWSWTGQDYRYRNPEVLPASPVQFHAQGGFQYCVGPVCVKSMHPGSIIQINGNWIVTGYKWWLG